MPDEMKEPVRIIGSYLSPYVRKVLACLNLKGIPYEIDPIVPFLGDDRFSKVSPIRRIPVLIDDQVTLCDSSVICEYLDDRHPDPPIYPKSAVDRARARWLEEFADTRMGEVFIWRLFNQLVIKPFVWGEKTDDVILHRTINEDIPSVLDYLEGELPSEGFLFGTPAVADVTIASFFRNAAFARYTVDAARWPITAGFVGRVLGLEAFRALEPFENLVVRTPLPNQRAALLEQGAPLTRDSYGTTTPRRGVMQI